MTSRHIWQQRFRKILPLLVIIAIVIIGISLLRDVLTADVKRSRIKVAAARLGSIENTLTANGTVVPEYEHHLTTPISSRIDTVFYRPGDQIQAGDRILALNKEKLLQELTRQEETLAMAQNHRSQLRLEFQQQQYTLQTELQIKLLMIQALEFRLEQQRQLSTIGAALPASVQEAELNLQIARLQLQQIEHQLDIRLATFQTDSIAQNLEIGIQESQLVDLQNQLYQAAVRSPWDGIVTWVQDEMGTSVQAGEIIARVADLTRYQVEARISDVHAERLQVGQPLWISLNTENIAGTVRGVQPMVQNGVITFIASLDRADHPQLRPNQRVEVSVVTGVVDNIIQLPNGSYANGLGMHWIFVVDGDRAIRRQAQVVAANLDYVGFSSGVEEGDQVIISSTDKFQSRKSVRLTD